MNNTPTVLETPEICNKCGRTMTLNTTSPGVHVQECPHCPKGETMKDELEALDTEIQELKQKRKALEEKIAQKGIHPDDMTDLLERTWEATYFGTALRLRSARSTPDKVLDLFDDCTTSYNIARLPNNTTMHLREIEHSEEVYLEILGNSTIDVLTLIKNQNLNVSTESLIEFKDRIESIKNNLQRDIMAIYVLASERTE